MPPTVKHLSPVNTGQFFRIVLVLGIALAAAGLGVDAAPAHLPIRLRGVTSGIAVAGLGGGLAMVAATSLAGHRLFTGPPKRVQKDS
jgi:hypothetical protein